MRTNYPDLDTAERMLLEAEKRNPGPWVLHSRNVALAAKTIAGCCPGMDAEKAYVLGLLHDIGRREGAYGMRHALDGYRFCLSLGFPEAARICMTHSFPTGNIGEAQGEWHCTEEDYRFVKEYLADVQYNKYDRLIQLCDSLAPASGFCLMEKRLVDVVLRNGANEYTQQKWQAFFEIKKFFEKSMNRTVYEVLPGAVENTFGIPRAEKD